MSNRIKNSNLNTRLPLAVKPAHLGINWPTLLHHWVEAWRHGLVLAVRCARSARRAGTAVVGRVRHSSRQRASYRGRLGGAKEFVCQSICGDWGATRRVKQKVDNKMDTNNYYSNKNTLEMCCTYSGWVWEVQGELPGWGRRGAQASGSQTARGLLGGLSWSSPPLAVEPRRKQASSQSLLFDYYDQSVIKQVGKRWTVIFLPIFNRMFYITPTYWSASRNNQHLL